MIFLCLSLGLHPHSYPKQTWGGGKFGGGILFGNNPREQEWGVGQLYSDGKKSNKACTMEQVTLWTTEDPLQLDRMYLRSVPLRVEKA